MILISDIQHLHNFPIGDGLIGIQCHVHFGLFRCARLQKRSQLVQSQRLFLIITESGIVVQVLINDNPCQRLGGCLLFSCGSNTLIAFGDTTVEVIIKKINSRNITSVMDAILKLGDIFALRCNTVVVSDL